MKSYFLELWGFGNLSFLFFVHDFLSSRVKLVHLAKNNCFIVGAEVCCGFFFFFSSFWREPSARCFPFCPRLRVPSTFGLHWPVRKSNAAPFPKQFVCRNAKHPGNLRWEGLQRSPETSPFCSVEKHTSLSSYSALFTLTHYAPMCLFYLLGFCTHWHG